MPSSAPHILFITSDQMRTDAIAAYGRAAAVSPHLDRVAREGVLFVRAFTTAPVCVPSRTTWLTGLHPAVHACGMPQPEMRFCKYSHSVCTQTNCTYKHGSTLSVMLRRAGYWTVCMPERHISDEARPLLEHPTA